MLWQILLCTAVHFMTFSSPSQWRHNGHDGISNHKSHHCLLNRLFRCKSKKTSKLRVTGFVQGIHRWPVNSPHKGPVTQKKFPFDDIIVKSVYWLSAVWLWLTECWVPQIWILLHGYFRFLCKNHIYLWFSYVSPKSFGIILPLPSDRSICSMSMLYHFQVTHCRQRL